MNQTTDDLLQLVDQERSRNNTAVVLETGDKDEKYIESVFGGSASSVQ